LLIRVIKLRSLLKRSIIGSYHQVSVKHLDAYLDELEHRFNNRKNEYIFRDTLTKLVTAVKLPYSELIKADEPLLIRTGRTNHKFKLRFDFVGATVTS
jgi:hypothetical protein